MPQVSDERDPTNPPMHSLGNAGSSQAAFDPLAGESPAIVRVREWLRGLAALRAPVLLLGEPGTGRRVAARLLHALGPEPEAAFVVVAARSGGPEAIPLRGTVHLHGIERLPPEGQKRWHRFIEAPPERTRLIGSAGPLFSDRVARGDFDAGLARALQRFEVRLPALRDRPADLPGLAVGLLASIGHELGRQDRQLTGGALRRLAHERWPGNLNELRRVVERLVACSENPRIGLPEVEAVLEELRPSVAELRARHQLEEREALIRNLEETGGNVTNTAERMQRSRAAIYRLVEKHGIALRRDG
ncbi:MAG: sigma 54-interacting transcriptional regulator [Deltaproteobacteria bacterium]|nr:sigma 54-interacting transcriptional regulator [Deltaproteobacteria bacterium]MBW2393195.1 sigma 54-interacting transcriptional regulator [Deltaproteobacteria bacterium]